MHWTRKDVRRTSTFWLIVLVFGMVDIGVTGLNLHVVSYVSDLGFTLVQAAFVMTVIAGTQTVSGLLWGFVGERLSVRKIISFLFLMEAAGLYVAANAHELWTIYLGFFFYGLGLGGVQVLEEVMWANYFGRISLGTRARRLPADRAALRRLRPAVLRFRERLRRLVHDLLLHVHDHAANFVRADVDDTEAAASGNARTGAVIARLCRNPRDPGCSTAGTSSAPASWCSSPAPSTFPAPSGC